MNCGFKKNRTQILYQGYTNDSHTSSFFCQIFNFFVFFSRGHLFSPLFRSKTYQKPLYSVFFCAILDLSIPFLCNIKRPAIFTTGYNKHLCNNDCNILVCGLQGFLMVKVEKSMVFVKERGFCYAEER